MEYINSKTYKNKLHGIDTPEKLDVIPDGKFAIVFLPNDGSKIGHWTLIIRNGKNWTYFDSESDPLDKEVIDLVKRSGGGRLNYNEIDIQSDNSRQCGHFVLYILDSLFSGKDYSQALKPFDIENYKKNTSVLNEHF